MIVYATVSAGGLSRSLGSACLASDVGASAHSKNPRPPSSLEIYHNIQQHQNARVRPHRFPSLHQSLGIQVCAATSWQFQCRLYGDSLVPGYETGKKYFIYPRCK